ncbi:MAG: hypothetical protein ACI837_003475 [Crocinitomicaceae bacterium]|jgi:hypothetical protein
MKILLLCTIVLIASTGCKSSFRISVKQPATIKVAESVASVAIVNSIDNTATPENVIGTILNAEPFNGNKVAGDQVPTGILRGLEGTNDMAGVTFVSDSMHLADGTVNWKYLESAAEANSFDAFIEVTSVTAKTNVGGAVAAAAEGKGTRIEGTALVNIYVIEDHQAVEDYRVFKSDYLPVKTPGTLLDVVAEAQKRKDKYRQLGINMGVKTGRLIFPNWVWVNRSYYTRGSDILKRSKDMIRNGNWDIAEKQLLMGLNDGSDKVQGRIHYNLALVKEGQGELDDAIKYAETAVLQYGEKHGNEYLQKLRKRKRIIELDASK